MPVLEGADKGLVGVREVEGAGNEGAGEMGDRAEGRKESRTEERNGGLWGTWEIGSRGRKRRRKRRLNVGKRGDRERRLGNRD